ncbi:MAG: pitrilysin family protein [Phycisphaeraceae bacterium]
MRTAFLSIASATLLVLALTSCKPEVPPGGPVNPQPKQNDNKGTTPTPPTPKDSSTKDGAPSKDGSTTKDSAATKDGSSKAPPPVTPVTPVTPVPAETYTVLQSKSDRLMVELPNRMIVIAQEMRGSPVVSSQVFIKTGSIYEQEHVGAGLSHYLEHLLSGGTTTTRSEDDSRALLGKMGAQTNAATSLNNVWYYINTTRPFAEEAIALLSDWMQNCTIEQKEFDRERDVIQQEFAMGEGEPRRIMWKLLQQARYNAHPARHPTIGYLDEFLSISREEIYKFYKRMYVPNNMVFVVAGDIDKQKVVDQIYALWKDQEPGELPKLSFPIEAPIDGPRELSGVADVRRPSLRLAWPGTRLGGEGDYAMDLLGYILGQGESSRLVQTVRDKQRLVNSISAYNASFTWGEGYFGIEGDVDVQPPAAGQSMEKALDEAIKATRAAVIVEIQRIQRDGITAEELARAKRQTRSQVLMSAQTAEDMADRLATDVIGMGDPDYLAKYAKAVQDITPEEVQAVARVFLKPERMITITLMPSAGQPPAPMQRPKDTVDPASLKQEPFNLDNSVVAAMVRSKVKAGGAAVEPAVVEPLKTYTLSNGLRLVVGRNTMIPAVAIEIYHAGGLLADEPGLEGVANATSIMQMRGTKTRTAKKLSDEIESLGASISTACGYNTHYGKASCLKEDWPQVIELLADVTLNPSFPEEEWATMQRRLEAAIERQSDTWNGELSLRFRQTYYKDHPWQTPPLGRKEVVAALKPENLAAFHKRYFTADQAVLAVFGDVDPDAVAKKAEAVFAAMPARSDAPFVAPIAAAPTPGKVEFATKKQTTAVALAYGPGVARNHPDYAPLQVLTRVASNFPSGWLDYELRVKDRGLVYATGAYQVTGIVPGYITALFNCGPQDIDEALKRTLAVFDRLRSEEVPSDDLARAKAAVLTGEFFGKQSNSDRAADAALNMLYGVPADESEQLLKTVQNMTAKQLLAVAKKYLKEPVVVVLRQAPADPPAPAPEKGAPKPPF